MTRMPHDLRSGICPSVDDPAYLAHKVLDDGRHVCLVVGPANTQLVVGPPCEEQYVAERWSYETILAGWGAANGAVGASRLNAARR